jgi:hypothetical protein
MTPFGYFRAEPFGWTDCAETDEGAIALYERPPAREWVGLTDEEIDAIYEQHHNQYAECISVNFGYERALEAKLKEKNT